MVPHILNFSFSLYKNEKKNGKQRQNRSFDRSSTLKGLCFREKEKEKEKKKVEERESELKFWDGKGRRGYEFNVGEIVRLWAT